MESINSFAPSSFKKSTPIKEEDITIGVSKVRFDTITLQEQSCCGNLLCFIHPTVTGIGNFTDQAGKETRLLHLDNGMFVPFESIDAILD